MKKKNFFAQYKQFTFFLILAVVIILIAVFAPVVSGGVDPLKGSLDEALLAPSKAHIFGTDKMGRDIFARVIYGARASLTATFGVVTLIFFIGTTLGVIAGYFGGIVDSVIMRIADMMLSFPGLVLALAVAGIMGASMKNAIVAVVVVNWTKYARLGLYLFVAVPLPGTGAWTGTLAASILDMDFKSSVLAVMLGVLLAGIIMGLASTGLLGGLQAIFA